MASLTFTDAIGTATLTNGKPAPSDRFAAWTPIADLHAESVTRLSDEALVVFRYGDRYGASFELRRIPVAAVSGTRYVAIAARLVRHLKNGGTVSIATGDVNAATYATCGLYPGASPSLTLADARNLEYTLALSVLNLAVSPVEMVCYYR